MPILIQSSEIHSYLPQQAEISVRLADGDRAFTVTSREASTLADRGMVEAVLSHKNQFRYLRLIVSAQKAKKLLRSGLRLNVSAQDNKTVSRIPTKSGHFYFEHNIRSYAYAYASA
jgi:hypothetical protein